MVTPPMGAACCSVRPTQSQGQRRPEAKCALLSHPASPWMESRRHLARPLGERHGDKLSCDKPVRALVRNIWQPLQPIAISRVSKLAAMTRLASKLSASATARISSRCLAWLRALPQEECYSIRLSPHVK
jgi:hypothetical protein